MIHTVRLLGVPYCEESRGGNKAEEGNSDGVKATAETEVKETRMV